MRKLIKSAVVAKSCRLLLAVLFLAAGGSKLIGFREFLSFVEGLKLLPPTLTVGFCRFVVSGELAIGLALICNIYVGATALVAVATLIIFTVFQLVLPTLMGPGSHCPCFQIAIMDQLEKHFTFRITRNIVMTALAAAVWLHDRSDKMDAAFCGESERVQTRSKHSAA